MQASARITRLFISAKQKESAGVRKSKAVLPLSWGGAEKEEVIATWQGAGEGANDEESRIITHFVKKQKARRLACRTNPRTF